MAIVLDSMVGVRFVEGILPIAAEEIPVLSIVRLQAGGGFITEPRAEARLADRTSVTDTGVGKSRGESKSEYCDGETRRGIGKAQQHSKVLCLEAFRDAR